MPALLYLLLSPRQTPARRLVAAWTLAAWAQVTLPGLYWPHYYLLPITGTATAVAVCLGDAAATLSHFLSRAEIDTAGDVHSSVSRRRQWKPLTLVVALLSLVALIAAVGATVYLQIRDYLLVPPQELTVRYKGGRQWVVLREMGRDVGRRAATWENPKLYVWGWQSPLHFYARLDSPTRHFFVDNLLRDQADRGHPLIAPRTEEIMAALRRNPPLLVFTGYAPFQALKSFLNEHYFRSRLMPGLWIKTEDFARFEANSIKDRSRSSSRPPRMRQTGVLIDRQFVSTTKSPHDGVPALAQGVVPCRDRHVTPATRVFDQFEERTGHALW
jgi:hypothetical protein